MSNTIGWNTLRKRLNDANREINQQLHEGAFKDDPYVVDYIKIYDESGIENIVKLEVNWSCIGSVSPEKAKAFGNALVTVSKWIEESGLNGRKITF